MENWIGGAEGRDGPGPYEYDVRANPVNLVSNQPPTDTNLFDSDTIDMPMLWRHAGSQTYEE